MNPDLPDIVINDGASSTAISELQSSLFSDENTSSRTSSPRPDRNQTAIDTWAHSLEHLPDEPKRGGPQDARIFYCKHCPIEKTWKQPGNLTTCRRHLKTHGIDVEATTTKLTRGR